MRYNLKVITLSEILKLYYQWSKTMLKASDYRPIYLMQTRCKNEPEFPVT